MGRVLVVAAILALGRSAPGSPPTGPVSPAVVASPPPATAMNLEQAYEAASALVGSRRHIESLPYFRRMIDLIPEDDWSLRHDYANALQGASMQSRTVLGLPIRAARSSFESIEFMRRALAELARAQRLARTPRAAASVHLARARQLGAWGLPADARFEARAAAEADRSWAQAALAARQWTRRVSGLDFSLSPDADSAASTPPAAPPHARPR